MAVEGLKTELEELISGLTSSGFDSIDSGVLEKLRVLAATAERLNMKTGLQLIENLSGAMKAIQEGKSKAESGNIRLTALDFYVKKLSGEANTEEL